MPLALELAAARVPTLGVRGVLDGLSDRFRLLTAGQRSALPRHKTLRATVEWSHRLLDETERTLFRRFAVFPAGFTVEAAHCVSGPDIEDRWRIIDLLGNLVGRSYGSKATQPMLSRPLIWRSNAPSHSITLLLCAAR